MKTRKISMWRNVWLVLTGVLPILRSQRPLDLPHSREILSSEREDIALLEWGYDREIQEIVLEIQTPIASWVALGLSPDGSLNKSDFVVGGWNKEKQQFFYDAHMEDGWPPVEDKVQDYDLIKLSRNDTHSVMRVWRKWFTCDPYDQEIEIQIWQEDQSQNRVGLGSPKFGSVALKNDTLRVIVIFGEDDDFQFSEDHTFRKSIFFLENLPNIVYPNVMIPYDFKLNDFIIPEDDTTYACTFIPMPRVSTKHHIIRYEAIIDPDSIGIVHHILVYACGNKTDITTEIGGCYGSDFRFSQCLTTMFGWAVGGEDFEFPPLTGSPIGTEHDPQYIRLEIHFSNFENKQGIKDSSGLRIFYTPELRQYDSGILMLGIFTFPVHFIPPGSENFRSYGLCNTHLIEEVLGYQVGDLEVNTFLLHGHLTVRGMRLMHYRNGTLIGSFGEDKKYDFKFQQIRNLPSIATIKMGDQIVVECASSTLDRDGVTYGGPSTLNEMCIGFLFYYPVIPIAACWSYIDIRHVAEALGMEQADSLMDAVMSIEGLEWDDENKEIAQRAVMESTHFVMVEDRNGLRVNETSPLPPISLPTPHHCNEDSNE